jgi:GDSL-like lipase/acylhydrolase family protein/SGNH-like hydrolase/esterase family protein
MDIAKLDKNMAIKDPEKDLFWYDAKELTIEGKGWHDTEEFFDRLPAKAKGTVRDAIWELSKSSAGISIHFTSNTSSLAVQWDGFLAMDHMPATGVSGVDLYVKHEGKWKWLAIGRPSKDMNETQLFADIPVEEREYILYLPLYNPVHTVKLGLPGDFEIKETLQRNNKPIVFYGTSITQGGCASRPGMCYTAILGRWLDHPTINLGFSGNGIMEPEVIDLLCELDPAVYVLDNLPNMQKERINEFEEDAIRKLRKAHPATPIVIVDNILYCNAFMLKDRMDRYSESNKAQYVIYEKLIAEGMTGLHYIKDNDLIGADGEATVDGCHFTDLGYLRFSEALIPVLKKLV